MPIYFINENDLTADTVKISGDNFHHLAHVLRCSAGEEVFVSDNKEKFRVKIEKIYKSYLETRILERKTVETGIEMTLIQCLPKKDKMDFVVGHCVELGIKNIIPVISERSIPRVNEDRALKFLSRFRKIAKEQAQRAGIEVLPDVSEVRNFDEAVSNLKGFDLALIPWEEEKSKKIKDILNNCTNIKKIAIIIGPEGGLSAEEVNSAKKAGAIPVSLGKTIFRTEIAGLVALSIIKYKFDWL